MIYEDFRQKMYDYAIAQVNDVFGLEITPGDIQEDMKPTITSCSAFRFLFECEDIETEEIRSTLAATTFQGDYIIPLDAQGHAVYSDLEYVWDTVARFENPLAYARLLCAVGWDEEHVTSTPFHQDRVYSMDDLMLANVLQCLKVTHNPDILRLIVEPSFGENLPEINWFYFMTDMPVQVIAERVFDVSFNTLCQDLPDCNVSQLRYIYRRIRDISPRMSYPNVRKLCELLYSLDCKAYFHTGATVSGLKPTDRLVTYIKRYKGTHCDDYVPLIIEAFVDCYCPDVTLGEFIVLKERPCNFKQEVIDWIKSTDAKTIVSRLFETASYSVVEELKKRWYSEQY